MTTSTRFQIPMELMDILTKINDSVNEVKERMTRLEAQDHAASITLLKSEIKEERDKRIDLQLELAMVKTKLAPIVISISVVGGAAVNFLLRVLGN